MADLKLATKAKTVLEAKVRTLEELPSFVQLEVVLFPPPRNLLAVRAVHKDTGKTASYLVTDREIADCTFPHFLASVQDLVRNIEDPTKGPN